MRIAGLALLLAGTAAGQEKVRLEQLDLTQVRTLAAPMGYPAKAGQSVAGTPLTIEGKVYAHGIGLHSGSTLVVDLAGAAESFEAAAGMDDAKTALPAPLPGSGLPQGLQRHPGTGMVQVWVDGRRAADTGGMRRGGPVKKLAVDLSGAKSLTLIVTDDGKWPYNNPVDLVDAVITVRAGSRVRSVPAPADARPQVASGETAAPAIHGPRVVGGSTGKPFLFRIPATGEGTLRFAAENLPPGLTVDPAKGFITGTPEQAGRMVAKVAVWSARGKDTRDLTIVLGDRPLAQTPPLGWNSWNVWARAVDDRKIRDAADWMVKSGLAAHGYQYIGIDDAWMGERDARGEIQPNAKFPDMKALADYVHARGLKFGIYSSPGPKTCQQMEGSYQHEKQDAETYAKWGVDLLKYDLCSYGRLIKGEDREEDIKPYRIMGTAIRGLSRDIVFSLCQYGRAGVGEWGPQVGGQMWRTTGDIRDSWDSMSAIGFDQAGQEKWAGPGRWNDTDMMVLGQVGWGVELHKARLSPAEEMAHVGLWSLLAAPMLLGCDLAQLDRFTLQLLTNDEVLDVNQDPLGKQASRVWRHGLLEVWARPMADGSLAVGLFNRGIEEARVSAPLASLGLSGRHAVRDLWQRRDAGTVEGTLTAAVPAHGVAMLRLK